MGTLLISRLQHEMHEWRKHNFGDDTDDMALGNDDSVEQFMGVVEEVGELSHIILKSRQGIRNMDRITAEELEADAVADIFIFLAGYCSRRRIDMEYVILKTWDRVGKRDWVKYPGNGVSE